jgi:hypothetical protein
VSGAGYDFVGAPWRGGLQQSTFCMVRRKSMITMGSPYFVWINANEIISSWYLLGAVCVTPPHLRGELDLVELLYARTWGGIRTQQVLWHPYARLHLESFGIRTQQD